MTGSEPCTLAGLGYEILHDLQRAGPPYSAGESDWVSTTFTTAAQPQVPGQPTGVTAVPGADSQMELRWVAAATGSVATGYRIERAADVLPREWAVIEDDTGTPATSWADSGLTAHTVYHYQVTGRNAAGLGTPAGAGTGTTRPQLALLASTRYPVTAHAWPLATAPVTHTWSAHESTGFDLVGQGPGAAVGTAYCASGRRPTVRTGCRPVR